MSHRSSGVEGALGNPDRRARANATRDLPCLVASTALAALATNLLGREQRPGCSLLNCNFRSIPQEGRPSVGLSEVPVGFTAWSEAG